MLLALPVRLETTDDEKALLLATMKKYNEAANFLAAQAFRLRMANKIELQKRFYRQIREQFNLSAQFAVRVISKVVEAYKKDKTIKPVFRELGAIQYDQRNMSWKGLDKVSLITLQGRLKLRARIGEYQKSRSDRIRGQADLMYEKGVFYLIAVVDAPEQSEFDAVGVLGIDLGIENIATDSDESKFSGENVEKARQRYNNQRRGLQRAKTTSRHRSAQRKLKKISGRERRFKRDVNHVISKAIVSKAKGTSRAIALEDLSGIRTRVTVRHTQRDTHSKWSFGQLRKFVEYKAKREGVPIRVFDPRNTSRQCPKCRCIDSRNRKTRSQFKCIECGYEAMADYVAATNIAARAAVNQPIVAPLFTAVTSPQALAVGS